MLLQDSKTISGKQSIIRPGFWQLSAAACSVLLNFCSIILITRALGPIDFGRYSFVLWIATVAVPALGIGTSALTSRHIAGIQSRETPRFAAGIFHFIWKQQFRSMLLYCLVYLLLVFPLSVFFGASAPLSLLLTAGLSAPPLLLSGVASITLRSLRRSDLLVAIHLFGATATLLLVTLAIQVQQDRIGMVLLIPAATSLSILILALIYIVRLLPLRQAFPPGPFLKDRLTRGFNNSLLLFTLDAIVWQRSELLLLGHSGSTADLGFYTLSSMISTRVMNSAPTLLSTCILPLLLRYTAGQRYTSAYDAYIKTTRYLIFLALPICLLVMLLCPTLVTLCFGPAYLPLVTPVRILLVPAAFGSISTVSLTHLANGDRKRAQVQLGIGAAVLKIVLSLPLITLWGLNGAAIASALAQSVSAIGSMAICRRLIRR